MIRCLETTWFCPTVAWMETTFYKYAKKHILDISGMSLKRNEKSSKKKDEEKRTGREGKKREGKKREKRGKIVKETRRE